MIYVCEEERQYEGSNIFYASLDYQDCVDKLMNKMLEMKKQREEIYSKVEQVHHNDYLWELIDGGNFYYRIHVFE